MDIPIVDLLLTPGTPFFALAAALVCVAAMGLVRLEWHAQAVAGLPSLLTRWGVRSRLALGQLAAIPLAGMLLLVMLATKGESARQLLFVLAAATYLYLGMVLPRKPLVQRQKEQKRLRKLTPGFVAHIRDSMAGRESPADLLNRFVVRPRPKLAVMQALVTESLDLAEQQRLRPFEALLAVARERAPRELIEVCRALAQAESEGADVQLVLAAQEETLERIIADEFQRMLKRRTLYLTGMVAVSLVIGILFNLLFVITGGGAVLLGTGV